MNTDYRARVEIYGIEPQHIWQQERHSTVVGGRFQTGHFEIENLQTEPSTLPRLFTTPAASQHFTTDFERWSLYGYHQWQLEERLRVIGGVVYDRVTFPENSLSPPVSERTSTKDQVSPKAGLIWTPADKTTVRFAFTHSLGGAGLDQSVRIEPTQVAGFNQAFRSVIPESVTGSIPGAQFETFSVSVEQKTSFGTYLGVSGAILNSEVERTLGAFIGAPPPPPSPPQPGQPPPRPMPPSPASASGLSQSLDFQERSLAFALHQLVADEWSVGARYRLTEAELTTDFVQIPYTAGAQNFVPRQAVGGVLHDLNLFCLFNHSSGFFSQFEADWYLQSNRGYAPDEPGDNFWQFNLFAGYRFPRRRAELRVGLLNIADRNYHLNPLTPYNELPRERTLMVRFQFNF